MLRSGRLSPAFLADAHANNLAVHVWTVNEADDMRRLLRWGVDRIMTAGASIRERSSPLTRGVASVSGGS
jgi:glycerophosphoryl diester phosphodiesterase